MLIYTFYQGRDNATQPRQLIGSIEGYDVRTAYLHLTGRNYYEDLKDHGVWSVCRGGMDIYPLEKLKQVNEGMD